MKILLLCLLLLIPFAYAESVFNFVPFGYFNTHACLQGGNCNISSLNVINTTVININTTQNITATFINANLSWNRLYDFPSACASGTAISQLNDAITCETFLQPDTDISVSGLTVYKDVNPTLNIYQDTGVILQFLNHPFYGDSIYTDQKIVSSNDIITEGHYIGDGGSLGNVVHTESDPFSAHMNQSNSGNLTINGDLYVSNSIIMINNI